MTNWDSFILLVEPDIGICLFMEPLVRQGVKKII